MRIQSLEVEDELDRDGDLEINIESDETNYVWLKTEEIIRLRDHLNQLLSNHNKTTTSQKCKTQ